MVGAVVAMGLSGAASAAQGFDPTKLYFGGGLSQNKTDKFSSSKAGTGYQFFGGYSFGELAPKLRVDAEAGYMDTGKMEFTQTQCVPILGCISVTGDAKAKGLWANGVARYRIAPQWELIGRVGQDFGDDKGAMFGVGGGFLLNNKMDLRLEYVMRDTVTSLQFNFIYRL
jgi:hypothetical protein